MYIHCASEMLTNSPYSIVTDQDVKVVEIKVHPDFQSDQVVKGNDIAILTLAESAWAQPVSLPIRGYPLNNQRVLALGWGQGHPILQQIFLDTQSDETCREEYPEMGQNILCASSNLGDTCKGKHLCQWMLCYKFQSEM